jgi:hypothetical protein
MMTLPEIPIALKAATVQQKLHIKERAEAERLIAEALALAEPRAAYTVGYIDEKRDAETVIDGRLFKSRVLRKNLDAVNRVFAAVVTLGGRLEAAADGRPDMLEKYYLDAIANIALAEARTQLIGHLCARFGLEKISWMSPGSLADWPIDEQRPLFALLDGVEQAIGVTLTESLLMLPRKSVSGIFFPSETTFFSCRLCPRERCEGRKARYDEALAKEYGLKTS